MIDKKSNTLVHSFLHWEQTQPDAVFLTEPMPDGRVIDYTWRQAGDEARRVAAYLQSLKLPPGSSIGIVGKNSAHWLFADLAIWLAGHVSVPLYPTASSDTARYVFDHCEIRVIFAGKLDGKTDAWNEIRAAVPEGVLTIHMPMSPAAPGMRTWEDVAAAHEPLRDVHLPASADMATIIYTSGSTGRPKGVMHSFGGMFEYATRSGEFCGFTTHDRVLSYLPLAHTAERCFIECNVLRHGFHVFFNDSLATFAQDLVRARPTAFISMPRLWTKFYQIVCAKVPAGQQALIHEQSPEAETLKKRLLGMLGLDAARIAFTGSAPLPCEISNWYRTLGLELLDVYGMTENLSYSHYSRPGLVRPGYSGQAMPGVQCRLGDNGEVMVKASTMMIGYYKEPALTADSFTDDGFFKTGDRGELDEIGRLKIVGRVKEIFKTSKGKYVAPAPIENKLGHPKVEAVCVTGHGYPQPFALLMLGAEARNDMRDAGKRSVLQGELQAMLDDANATLEAHEKLAFVVAVNDAWTTENGLLTPSLKIRRSFVEERYEHKMQQWSALGQTVIVE
ncbi:AMP-binding protein [Paraburkholderia sp. MPAMCS5]|uniref:AMP-binding protein n=1 Tax=Paraburkholderia sp. MPAMCS5 TaxID=3112563 RepID=UPI002E18AF2C|nr:AMP-binding protein [Paraburkholderia sp. MPAMCS5]